MNLYESQPLTRLLSRTIVRLARLRLRLAMNHVAHLEHVAGIALGHGTRGARRALEHIRDEIRRARDAYTEAENDWHRAVALEEDAHRPVNRVTPHATDEAAE